MYILNITGSRSMTCATPAGNSLDDISSEIFPREVTGCKRWSVSSGSYRVLRVN